MPFLGELVHVFLFDFVPEYLLVSFLEYFSYWLRLPVISSFIYFFYYSVVEWWFEFLVVYSFFFPLFERCSCLVYCFSVYNFLQETFRVIFSMSTWLDLVWLDCFQLNIGCFQLDSYGNMVRYVALMHHSSDFNVFWVDVVCYDHIYVGILLVFRTFSCSSRWFVRYPPFFTYLFLYCLSCFSLHIAISVNVYDYRVLILDSQIPQLFFHLDSFSCVVHVMGLYCSHYYIFLLVFSSSYDGCDHFLIIKLSSSFLGFQLIRCCDRCSSSWYDYLSLALHLVIDLYLVQVVACP